MQKFNEQYLRTLAKVVSWRLVQIIIFTVNTYIITGNLTLGFQLAGIGLVINSILYWAHERLWNKADWGRVSNQSKIFSEQQFRAINKMITWKILMIISLYLIAFISTSNSKVSFSIMSSIILVNFFAFWLHERIWNSIKWGKQKRA